MIFFNLGLVVMFVVYIIFNFKTLVETLTET